MTKVSTAPSKLDDVDHCLNKAADAEKKWFDEGKPDSEAGKPSDKTKANLYFKKAMVNDGNEDYKGDVI